MTPCNAFPGLANFSRRVSIWSDSDSPLACSILPLSISFAHRNANFALEMKSSIILQLCFAPIFTVLTAVAFSQAAAPIPASASTSQSPAQGTIASADAPSQSAVSYTSVAQLNNVLSQIEATSKEAQSDLAQLRIERWKTDGATKKQTLADVDSIQRNLQNALPEMMTQLHNSPEDLPATFKLYRNLDALYSVMGGVVESAGAFGPKDDFQAVTNDLSGFESARKQLAERLETLAGAKEQEIVRLRAELKTAQAAIPAPPPKKVIVDDAEPEKKPVAKKKAPVKKKPPATTTPTPTQTPPAEPKQQ
jgi:hypothetical protein